jgi:hypothetical protein
MIINPSLPGGYTIFCDDIRHEVSGKETLVGTYTNVMYVKGAPPFKLPKVCMAVVFIEETDSLEPVTIKVFFPGDDDDAPSAFMEYQPQPELIPPPSEEFQMREARMLLELPNAEIKQFGRFRVRAYRGDDEIRLGTLLVAPFPSEEQPTEAETNPDQPE